MSISVVIPARNMAGTVQRSIMSAVRAGCDDIIVVDDASEDGTAEAVRLLCASAPVRILSTGMVRAGVCHARNLGIQHARHDLIVPLDADDVLMPDGLRALYEAYRPMSFVYGAWLEGTQERLPRAIDRLHITNVAHATWLFERQAWLEVDGYHPDFNLGAEDWAFMLALVNAGYRGIRISDLIYRRAVNVGSRTDMARGRRSAIAALVREYWPELFVSENLEAF